MTKIIAMIPARMGSKRVPNKNIRLLNGKPLVAYAIEAAKKANCFDEIWVNSDSDMVQKIASEYGIKFYKRPDELASDSACNDDFAADFFKNVGGDILIQILPTSPFISSEEINNFVNTFVSKQLDTLISMIDVRIECVFDKQPINFDQKTITLPSQTLTPIKAYGCSLMGWRKENYLKNMEKYSAAYHGGDGNIDYFTLKGYSTIDIDNEEDFQLAELAARHLAKKQSFSVKYYGEQHSEIDVPVILSKDGVRNSNYSSSNQEIININDIVQNNSANSSWCHRVINTENNSATLISQLPGEGNRKHYHPDWNEWWYIVDGEWEWEIDGKTKIVKKDDFVFIPKNIAHKIKAIGDKPAIRLAVSRDDVIHVYPDGDYTNESGKR